jgi:hypothetical protein
VVILQLTGATEEYDGTSWATSWKFKYSKSTYLAGAGTQTAALGFGGSISLQFYSSNRRI